MKTNNGLVEIWKDIENYPNYQVSNFGYVRCTNYHREHRTHLLAFIPDSDGYLQVKLCKNGIVKFKRVHRLVAEAFIENKTNKEQVNHIDGNKTNNAITNLEWATSKENMHHAFKTGLMANVYKPRPTMSKIVYQFDNNKKLIKKWNSLREIEKKLNISHSTISYACKNKKQKLNSFWSFGEVV